MAKKTSSTIESSDHYDGDGHDHVVRPGADLTSITMVDPVAAFAEPMEFNLDDYVGYTYRGKPIVDLDQVVDQIWTGRTVDSGNNIITYTFNELAHTTGLFNNPNYGLRGGNDYSAFNDGQRAEARDSIELWDDLVSATFKETEGRGADIVFANSSDPAQAFAYYPVNGRGYNYQSDVFIADPELNWTNNWLGFNGYGATTLIHELGHAIGLSHPGAYNGAGATTYLAQAEYAQDSEQYSIMSYWSPSETGARIVDFTTFFYGNAQTPMLHDILAIQEAYGADETTRADDTTYGFNSTAGREVFDFSLNSFPNVAIYDAGGTDTIDLSGFDAGVQLDLHAGSFSSAAQAIPTAEVVNAARAELNAIAGGTVAGTISQASVTATGNSFKNANAADIAADTGVAGVFATSYMNIAIAYGVTIENGIGGSMRDVLWGNEVDNVLEGRGGDDVLNGFEGADMLLGGDGADTFQFWHMDSVDTIGDFASGEDMIDVSELGFTSFSDTGAFSGTAGELIYADGMLMGDVDGDGQADFMVKIMGDAVDAGDLLL